jgi:putative Ca2+/H+ antiporter (TMEM165/GDT1 family)
VDALLLSFVAGGLAEWGDKTQLLALALVLRFGRLVPVLAGLAVAALANAGLAAFAGTVVHDMATLRALSLLVAIALLFAGVAGFIPQQTPPIPERNWRIGPFLTSAILIFGAEFADKTQFLTFGIAAQYDSLWLASAGAAAGVVAANIPLLLLAKEGMPPAVKPIRLVIAGLFLLAGLAVAISALRLA